MMRTAITQLIVIIGFQLSVINIYAQYEQPSPYAKWEVGAGLSALIYQGDLTPHKLGSIETVRPGLLIFGNYKLKPQLRLQASASIGTLKGNDAVYNTPAYRKERNFLFTTSVKELMVGVQYQIHKSYLADQALLYPYIGVGVGINFINVKTDYSKLTSKLALAEPNIVTGIAVDIANGTPKKLLFIPITMGVRKMFTPRLDLFAEIKYRLINTDYIDGVSKAAGSKNKDKYYSANVGVVYKFYTNKGIKCPKY